MSKGCMVECIFLCITFTQSYLIHSSYFFPCFCSFSYNNALYILSGYPLNSEKNHCHVFTMFLCFNPIHHSSSDQYSYLYIYESWLGPEYNPLHRHYLKNTWNIVMYGKIYFVFAIFTSIVVIFCYLKEYY